MTTTTTAPAQLDGYTLEQRPNQLARRGCWYVRHDATGVLIGWIGLVNRNGAVRSGEGDGWSAVSFAHRDSSGPRADGDWFRGRIVWGDEDRTAGGALDSVVAATGALWLHEQAERPPLPTPTPHDIIAAEKRQRDRWYSPYLEDMRRQAGR